MVSTKPYLLRAIYEWAEDNGLTPQVLVNAEVPDVVVPQEHVVDGQIILNIGSSAVQLHSMDNEFLRFSARFSGIEQSIVLPIESINAIFARENSQGIFFEEHDDESPTPEPTKSTAKDTLGSKVGPGKSPAKQANKSTKPSHLKIIK